jgi:hypothetical protein
LHGRARLLDFFSRERVQLEVIERLAILGDAELDTVEASHRVDDRQEPGAALAIQRVQAAEIAEHGRRALRAHLELPLRLPTRAPDASSAGCLQRRPRDASALSARRR